MHTFEYWAGIAAIVVVTATVKFFLLLPYFRQQK